MTSSPTPLRPANWTDSYAVVLLTVIATYIVSVSVTEAQAASIVLTVQLATVWFTLRASHAHRVTRRVADIALALAAVIAVVTFFFHEPGGQLGGIFVACSLLYLIAPFAIVRYLMSRPEIDSEALLGAVAAYLLIGMFFAFLQSRQRIWHCPVLWPGRAWHA